MKVIPFEHLFLLILTLINLSGIFSAYPDNYTYPLLFKVRIGSQSTEIKLLLNTFNANNILFTNTNRNYYQQISKGRKSDAYTDKLELNGEIIPDFAFSLILDNTGFNSQEIQGEFGLGIDLDYKNDLVENLYYNQIITQRKLLLEISKDLKSVNLYFNSELNTNEFKYCNLSRKIDLGIIYNEVWICELSHIIKIEDDDLNSNLENIFEKTKPVNARAIFDSRQKNLIFPTKYLDSFQNFFNLKNCQIITDKYLGEKYIQCDRDNILSSKKSIYFVIDGYGIIFTEDELFETKDDHIVSIIRFSDSISKSNLIIFGIPLFKKYNILLDYENKNIGFKGDKIYDFKNIYKQWLQKKNTIKIITEESNVGKNNNNNETDYREIILLIAGIIVGICIIICVFYYHHRRIEEQKNHSELIEEQKKMKLNNQYNNNQS